ncbi:hypothetical protein [Aureivirga marina]|uniref:hypothetical protein n=1 Tax=Aureivirga marina TaxID=1182451 RepID=UPI0018CA1188|nr:hypothetical protein [Aureivirga marina]
MRVFLITMLAIVFVTCAKEDEITENQINNLKQESTISFQNLETLDYFFLPFDLNNNRVSVGLTGGGGNPKGIIFKNNGDYLIKNEWEYIVSLNETNFSSGFNGNGLGVYEYDASGERTELPNIPDEPNFRLFSPNGINSQKQIPVTTNNPGDSPNSYLWNGTDYEEILIPNTNYRIAHDVNELGDVLVETDLGIYIWNQGNSKRIEAIPTNFIPTRFNDSGQIIGNVILPDGIRTPWFYSDGKVELLPINNYLGMTDFFYPRKINNNNLIVGYFKDYEHKETPVVWFQHQDISKEVLAFLTENNYTFNDSGFISCNEKNDIILNVIDLTTNENKTVIFHLNP